VRIQNEEDIEGTENDTEEDNNNIQRKRDLYYAKMLQRFHVNVAFGTFDGKKLDFR
jgi:hypothetical protein